MHTTTVGELIEELAGLPADQEVPADLLLHALPSRYELSYVEAALSQWSETAETYGGGLNPEVDAFVALLQDVL